MIYPGVSLDQIQIADCGELIRVGREQDGGYVLPKSVLEACSRLISFGISTDWSFEADFLSRNSSNKVFAYDGSIGWKYFSKRIARSAFSYVFHSIFWNAKRRDKSLNRLKNGLGYFQFFKERAQHFELFVGSENSESVRTCSQIFADLSSDLRHNFIMKIDIEGAEYHIIDDVLEQESSIACVVMEFHDTDICASAISAILVEFSKKFVIAHVHGNNAAPAHSVTGFPKAVEITFVARRMLDPDVKTIDRHIPIAGLDYPNHPDKPDLEMKFAG